MKLINTYFNQDTQPLVKGSSKTFGLSVGSDTPSANVTCSFASANGFFTISSALTFTSVNHLTPQPFTLTGVADAVIEGFKNDLLIVTLTGGGYDDVTISIPITICDTGLDYQFLSGWSWYDNIKVKTLADIASKRTSIINYFFNGNGLPTSGAFVEKVAGYTGAMGQTSTGAITGGMIVDRIMFNITHDGYDWPAVVYHIRKSGNTKVTFVCGGHGSEAYHVLQIQDRVDAGNDVLYCFLLCTFENQNRTILDGSGFSAALLHPGAWPSRGVGAHNNMITSVPVVESPAYSGQELFMYHIFKAKEYLKANFGLLDTFYFTGASGGGLMTLYVMAMDEEFNAGVSIRGVKPNPFRVFSDESAPASWDFEQGPTGYRYYLNTTNCGVTMANFFINTVTFFDLIAMACSSGRPFKMSHHAADSCCLGKFTYLMWKDYYKDYLSTFGFEFELTLSTDPTYINHGFHVNDRAIVMDTFV